MRWAKHGKGDWITVYANPATRSCGRRAAVRHLDDRTARLEQACERAGPQRQKACKRLQGPQQGQVLGRAEPAQRSGRLMDESSKPGRSAERPGTHARSTWSSRRRRKFVHAVPTSAAGRWGSFFTSRAAAVAVRVEETAAITVDDGGQAARGVRRARAPAATETPDVRLVGLRKTYGDGRRRRTAIDLEIARGRVLHAARPLGLRQDDDAADDRRLRGARRRARSSSPAAT